MPAAEYAARQIPDAKLMVNDAGGHLLVGYEKKVSAQLDFEHNRPGLFHRSAGLLPEGCHFKGGKAVVTALLTLRLSSPGHPPHQPLEKRVTLALMTRCAARLPSRLSCPNMRLRL